MSTDATTPAGRDSRVEAAISHWGPRFVANGVPFKDRLTGVDQATKLAERVKGPCVLSIVEGGNHVVNNYWYRYRDQTADWMAKQLV